jgi:hypothetical protein
MIELINVNSGSAIHVPTGFSWTSLFFGSFVPLFRGDIMTAALTIAICVFTAGFAAPIVWVYLAFAYNTQHIRNLEAKGYVTARRYEELKTAGKAV